MNVKIAFSDEQRKFFENYPKTKEVLEKFDLKLRKVTDGELEGYAIGNLENLLMIDQPAVKKFIHYFEKFLYEPIFQNKLRAYVDWDMIYLINAFPNEFLGQKSQKIFRSFFSGSLVYKEFIKYADEIDSKSLEDFFVEFIQMKQIGISIFSETAEILVTFKEIMERYNNLTPKEAIYLSYFYFYIGLEKIEFLDSLLLNESNAQIAKAYIKRDLEENEKFFGQLDKIFQYWITEVDLFKLLNYYGDIVPNYEVLKETEVIQVYYDEE